MIDQQITKIKEVLWKMHEMSVVQLAPELRELQSLIVWTHAHIESHLELRILVHFALETHRKPAIGSVNATQALLEHLSFRKKVEIVQGFKDGIPDKKIFLINKYRNQFAHPIGLDLRNNYLPSISPKHKESYRNILRALLAGVTAMEEYISGHKDKMGKLTDLLLDGE